LRAQVQRSERCLGQKRCEHAAIITRDRLLDAVTNRADALLAAQECVLADERHLAFALRDLHKLRRVDSLADPPEQT
jgi:hypothetical protein